MKKTIFTLSAFAFPLLASAALPTVQPTEGGNLTYFVLFVSGVVNFLVPLVSTLAVVYFFYGLAKYILNSGDEDKRKEGKDIMIWGILAMFVIVTIWGIIGFIQATIGNTGVPTTGTIVTPGVGAGSVNRPYPY